MHGQQKLNNPIDQVASEPQPPPTISPFIRIFASALYSGYSPVASGTAGTLVGLLFYLIPGFEEAIVVLPACAIVFVLGSIAAGEMEKLYGQDPSAVTIDEVLGMWISLLFLPKSIVVIVAAFFIFRALDVFKPWPARTFDRKHGGWNIMLDDVIAGIYTNLILQLATKFL